MRFVLDALPLVVTVGATTYADTEFDEMCAGFDALFARGERYALITYTPDGGEMPSARARKRIADWADSPRIRSQSKKLCVASATVVQSALARGALTAIMWVWKPAAPHRAVAHAAEGIDWCLERLAAESIPMPLTREAVYQKLGTKAFGASITGASFTGRGP